MTIFQMVSALFALFMMYVVSIHGNKKNLSFAEVSFWWTTWFTFILIALFPNLLLGIVGVLNFGRVFDLLLVMALMVLSVIVFLNYFGHKEMARKMEDLVRAQALEKHLKSTSIRKRKAV